MHAVTWFSMKGNVHHLKKKLFQTSAYNNVESCHYSTQQIMDGNLKGCTN